MKLQNKKTGEIGNLIGLCVESGKYELAIRLDGSEKQYFDTYLYDTFDEFRKEWEDYEEPEGAWFIDCDGNVVESELVDGKVISLEKQAIGNFFATKEEAEKAVEKLKAWKRLKDKGFKFSDWIWDYIPEPALNITANIKNDMEIEKDLDLLFGGKK